MESSQQGSGDGNMQGSYLPNMTGEGVIPASFFDMPIEYGSGEGNIDMDFSSIPGFPATDVPMSNASDFDALTAQISASMPSFDPASSYPMAGPSHSAQPPLPPQDYSSGAAIKMEIDDPNSVTAPSPALTDASTPKPGAVKAKKSAKSKTEGGPDAKPKPKKPKKKPADATKDDATASGSATQSSKDAATSPAPKKKATKKKAAGKDDANQQAPPSATASPAPFATPASPSKEAKAKAKKTGGSKAGAKAASKARSSTARSASRMSSIGRDATTPGATSRVGSQRPHDETNEDDEPASNPQAAPPQEDDDAADDEDADADDGVEELGRDHFSTQEAIYAAQQRNMGLLSMVMDEDQLDRHMASRRGALNKTSVRRLVNHVLSQSVSQHVAMVVSGVAKIFVGEIIEKAREIQSIRGEQGALRPNHLREAHRQYYMKRERPGHYPPGTNTGFPGLGKKRRMF